MSAPQALVVFLCVALPWLNPFAPGPSAAMLPWLVSLACVGAALLASPVPQVGSQSKWRSGWRCMWCAFGPLFFAGVALWFAARGLWQGPGTEALATVVAWACVLAMAHVGAQLLTTQLNPSVHAHAAFSALSAASLRTGSLQAAPLPAATLLAATWLGIALLSVLMALCQYLRIEHWFAPWISHSEGGAAFANLRQRNQFATLCGIGLLALLYLQQTTLQYGAAKQNSRANANATSVAASVPMALGGAAQRWHAAWPWLAVTALAIGNGLSSSRTGALQWALIAAALLCWRTSLHRKMVQLGLGALAIYAVVVTLMPWFASAVGNSSNGLWGRASENAGSSSRLWLYSNVLELIAQKPWLGWGWRELAFAHYSTHFDQRFGELLDNAHNLPLHLAVELGVPFALMLCGTVLWWVVRSAPWRETDATRQLAWGVLMLIGVHSMVEYPLWYGPFLMTLGLCIGLLQPVNHLPEKFIVEKSLAQSSMPNTAAERWNIAGAAIKGVAFCLLVFAGYAAYDYHRVSQIYLDVDWRSSLYSGDALGHAQRSVLYQRQARFAELVTTPITPASAPRVLSLAAELIHFSPEPRVIEALIESATMLHMDDVAMFHLGRYKEVYPKDYAAWSALK
jgi:Virulence factor membrane-bound polymerase, C-terminal/O-Antigen ligase/Protein glycosylation ligase